MLFNNYLMNFLKYNHKTNIVCFFTIYSRTFRKNYLIKTFVIKNYATSVFSNYKFLTSFELKTLKTLCKKLKKKGKIINLSNIIQNSLFLKISYKILILKFKKITALNKNNIFCYNKKIDWFFKDLSYRLKNKSFKFMNITNKKETKSTVNLINLCKFRNEIVSQAIELVFENIYEPVFLPTSHGYRPCKGCHSALKQIKLYWVNISWVLSYTVETIAAINYKRIINLLLQKIDDNLFFHLLFNFFYVNPKKEIFSENSVPILSPILINIYLHELDLELFKLQQTYSSTFRNKKHLNYCNNNNLKNVSFRTMSFLKFGRLQNHKIFLKKKKTSSL